MSVYNLKQNDNKNEPVVEIEAKVIKRQHTLRYKRKILEEASKLTKPGELGALLRREGLSSSTFYAWRVANANGRLRGSNAHRRGPAPQLDEGQRARLRKLERENATLKKRVERAEALVELQKKMAEVLITSEELSEGRKS